MVSSRCLDRGIGQVVVQPVLVALVVVEAAVVEAQWQIHWVRTRLAITWAVAAMELIGKYYIVLLYDMWVVWRDITCYFLSIYENLFRFTSLTVVKGLSLNQ